MVGWKISLVNIRFSHARKTNCRKVSWSTSFKQYSCLNRPGKEKRNNIANSFKVSDHRMFQDWKNLMRKRKEEKILRLFLKQLIIIARIIKEWMNFEKRKLNKLCVDYRKWNKMEKVKVKEKKREKERKTFMKFPMRKWTQIKASYLR